MYMYMHALRSTLSLSLQFFSLHIDTCTHHFICQLWISITCSKHSIVFVSKIDTYIHVHVHMYVMLP